MCLKLSSMLYFKTGVWMSKEQSLEMIKGYDGKGKAFTVFVLCTAEDRAAMEDAKVAGRHFDITKLHIIYQMVGHDITPRIQNDVKVYSDMYFSSLPRAVNVTEEESNAGRDELAVPVDDEEADDDSSMEEEDAFVDGDDMEEGAEDASIVQAGKAYVANTDGLDDHTALIGYCVETH